MPVEPIKHEIHIPEQIKISELALKMTTKAGEVLKVMMGMGVMATLNDVIDQDTAILVVEEMGHTPIALLAIGVCPISSTTRIAVS